MTSPDRGSECTDHILNEARLMPQYPIRAGAGAPLPKDNFHETPNTTLYA
jgi:hypothetical protein